MIRKCFIIALSLTALFYATPIHTMEPRLKPYATEIFNIIDTNCKKVKYIRPIHTSFVIGKLFESQIGLCDRNAYRFVVTIDEGFWNKADELSKFQVVAHEITHCVLGVDHSMDPANYMFPSINYDLSREQIIAQFLQNLKNTCSKI